MAGPGGYYNLGNALSLLTGLGVQLAAATMAANGEGEASSLAMAAQAYFVGSPGATALTLAMLIFFASGEIYHRAWSHGFPPDRTMNRLGDLLSAIGAAFLAIALAAYGQFLLAAVAGALLAGGKLGSALVPEGQSGRGSSRWPIRFRLMVLASRLPALAALGLELALLLGQPAQPPAALIMPGVMLVCTLLWARADLLLVQPSPALTVPDTAPVGDNKS